MNSISPTLPNIPLFVHQRRLLGIKSFSPWIIVEFDEEYNPTEIVHTSNHHISYVGEISYGTDPIVFKMADIEGGFTEPCLDYFTFAHYGYLDFDETRNECVEVPQSILITFSPETLLPTGSSMFALVNSHPSHCLQQGSKILCFGEKVEIFDKVELLDSRNFNTYQ